MTPASAALGPAVQATVPSTPHSASYNAMFTGNVFERAEALLSSNVSHSRSGTLSSSFNGVAASSDNSTGQYGNSPAMSMNSRFNNNHNKVSF